MYRIEYNDNIKDTTYDDAYYSSLNNNSTKWSNYYTYLKERNDLCYNVESVTIDVNDIEKMKFECFSNDILLKLYLKCKSDGILEKNEVVTILNNNPFNAEVIYNIFKTEWLIDERLLENDLEELKRRENYFKAMIEVSEAREDIKIQFRNKLYQYFIDTINRYREEKTLKLNKTLPDK